MFEEFMRKHKVIGGVKVYLWPFVVFGLILLPFVIWGIAVAS